MVQAVGHIRIWELSMTEETSGGSRKGKKIDLSIRRIRKSKSDVLSRRFRNENQRSIS